MPRVLAVDDREDNLALLGMVLEDADYEVIEARSGEQALALADARTIDAILLDINMPGMDGIETCRRLKANPSTEPIPVIMLSAYADDDKIIEGLDAGAQDYVTKPFREEIVLARLRSAVRIKTAHDETLRLLALLESTNAQLERQSLEDALTGLGNRRAMDLRLIETDAAADRYGRGYAILLLDIDLFKKYNDHYGHPPGDAVLRTVGGLLAETTRRSDLAFRYGGEELLVLMPDTDLGGAVRLGERMLASLRALEIEHVGSPMGRLTASIGVSVRPAQHAGSWSTVLDHADQALYRAKHEGRDRVRFAVVATEAVPTERA